MRAALVLGLLLTVTLPASANDDFTKVVKDALASAEPTTAVLRGLATLGDFDMGADEVARSLADAGAKTTNAAAQAQVDKVLGDVTRITKKKDRITIERRAEQLLPIEVAGKSKGSVKLG